MRSTWRGSRLRGRRQYEPPHDHPRTYLEPYLAANLPSRDRSRGDMRCKGRAVRGWAATSMGACYVQPGTNCRQGSRLILLCPPWLYTFWKAPWSVLSYEWLSLRAWIARVINEAAGPPAPLDGQAASHPRGRLQAGGGIPPPNAQSRHVSRTRCWWIGPQK